MGHAGCVCGLVAFRWARHVNDSHLPTNVHDGIMALFRAVYRIVQRYGPLTELQGDAKLIPLTGGTIIPSYHSRFAGLDILRFIAMPFHGTQGDIVKNCEFPWHPSLAPTVRPRRRSFFIFGLGGFNDGYQFFLMPTPPLRHGSGYCHRIEAQHGSCRR